ncbi:MAG: hypothetical protein AB1689_04850 [Thermodesulfobacteriota bacterium]
MPAPPASARTGIRDVFYETRVLAGREYTLKRFAEEVLGASIDPVMLGYIEKGKRFPSEALVRRLAAFRKQDPRELLAVLARDRMLHAFGKELRRVLHAPAALGHVDDIELALLASQAIAALPDDGTAITVARWRREIRASAKGEVDARALGQVEQLLAQRGLIALERGKVRRLGRHFVAVETEERQALALEFCTLFAKGLLDKLVLPDQATGSYIRNHYLNIDRTRLDEFERRLDAELRKLAEEYAADASEATSFLNVLVTATVL